MEIKYIAHVEKDGRLRAGWYAELDGKEYGNELILEHEAVLLSEDVVRIIVFNAGESMATLILGEPEFPPDDPTDVELLKFGAMQAARSFLHDKAKYQFDTNGFTA